MNRIQPEVKLAILEDILAGQDSRIGLAEKYKVHPTTIDRLRSLYDKKKNGTTLRQLAGVDQTDEHAPVKRGSRGKYAKLIPKWQKLHDEGFSHRQIAKRFKTYAALVSYHLRKVAKESSPRPAPKVAAAHTNGSKPTIHPDIVVGMIYADIIAMIEHGADEYSVPVDRLGRGIKEVLEAKGF